MSTDPFTEHTQTSQPNAEVPQPPIGPQLYGQPTQEPGQPTQQPTSWTQPQFNQQATTVVPSTTWQQTPNPRPLAVEHPHNIPGLVCGVVGMCGVFPVGIAALVMGLRANRDIKRHPDRYTGQGMALANIILGAIGTGLTVMAALFAMLVFIDIMMW